MSIRSQLWIAYSRILILSKQSPPESSTMPVFFSAGKGWDQLREHPLRRFQLLGPGNPVRLGSRIFQNLGRTAIQTCTRAVGEGLECLVDGELRG